MTWAAMPTVSDAIGKPAAGAARRAGAPGPRSQRRRWLRLAIPLAVAFGLLFGSLVAYRLQQPDPADPAFLSPTSDADTGGRRLAGLLAGRGVPVDVLTSTSDALVAAYRGDATLFIPAPDLVHPYYLRMIKLLPASTRVVLVAPSQRTLERGLLPAAVADDRLAARAAPPDCGYPPAVAAGTAGVHRFTYATGDKAERCYGDSLVVMPRGAAEVVLVGANDPFRNDRIGEHHNGVLAAGLLSRSRRLLWLDLHRPERRPGYVDDESLANQPPAPASLGPGPPDEDFPLPASDDPGSGGDDASGGGGDSGSDTGQAQQSNPLWRAFPPWVFTTAALIALAAILLAVAYARRLGPPVAEPLPVSVRASETVEGRGRLYRRAKARGPALRTLRATAHARLIHLLDLPPDAPPAVVVATLAEHLGTAPDDIDAALYGPDPTDDRGLVQRALAIDTLLQAVTRQAPSQPAVPQGDSR